MKKVESEAVDTRKKYTKLLISLGMDALGMLSYTIPVLGEGVDLVWAPLSSFVLSRLYKGRVGQVGALVNFIEELAPGLDLVPTFTLTWVYTYWMKSKK